MNNTILNQLEDLFIDAVEQGSSYWMHFNLNKSGFLQEMNERYPNLCMSERIWAYLNQGHTFKIYDIESGDFLGLLSFDNFANAINTLQKDYRNLYDEIKSESWDSNTSDAVMQIAVMGEIVFG